MNRWKPIVTFKPAVAKPVNTRPKTYINVSVKNGKFASNTNASHKSAYDEYWSTTSLMPTPNGKGTINPLARSPTDVNVAANTNIANKSAYNKYWSTTYLMPTPNGKGTINPLAKRRKTRKLSARKNKTRTNRH